MTTSDPGQAGGLLQFARDVYARPGIQAVCLRLQDEHGIDVVLLLACCWYGCYYGELSESQTAQVREFSEQWRAQLVAPLRQARRWLKAHPANTAGIPAAEQEALRQRIKVLELEAEFMQLRALAALFAAPKTGPDFSDAAAIASIRVNLHRYCDHAPAGASAGLSETDIAALLHACMLSR